jgi:hypothetical protein
MLAMTRFDIREDHPAALSLDEGRSAFLFAALTFWFFCVKTTAKHITTAKTNKYDRSKRTE